MYKIMYLSVRGMEGSYTQLWGRITLLKLVLSSLSIFMLSFYKAPTKFVKEFTKIQSNFFWSSLAESKKIHWQSWRDVCLPIERGGLGIKRIKDFYVDLLQKWRWIIMVEFDSLWYKVLKSCYDDINLKRVNFGDFQKKHGNGSFGGGFIQSQ